MSEVQAGSLVLLRGRDSGVVVGRLVRWEGQCAALTKPQRVWSWQGLAEECIELARYGCGPESRIGRPGDFVAMTDVLEVHTVHPDAAESLTTPRWP